MSVGKLYDVLVRFESRKHRTSYPVHKRLKAPYTENWLVEWITKGIRLQPGTRVLDAGCGTGHTLLQLAGSQPIEGIGISLSKEEINVAMANKTADTHVQFLEQSYDAPLPGTFDLIIACESLRHSPDLKSTLNHWLEALAPGGKLIITDDFLEDEGDLTRGLIQHQKDWQAPQLLSENRLDSILPYTVSQFIENFTTAVPTRSKIQLSWMIFFLQFGRAFTWGRTRQLLNIYIGGLLLELGYVRKKLKYLGLIISK
ncbi:MAG TPA: hypothetical protein DCE41_17935 [Cytophagales bacterium]|nr:hypothetical protein [Cytophagales bacterium]HAA23646.1 hypothetical protein [Cytophagales bacterium]HAP65369.1 hypothetical protein [Cytophagales bacterium]